MEKLIFISLSLLIGIAIYSQEPQAQTNDFVIVDQMPVFKYNNCSDPLNCFKTYLNYNLNLPKGICEEKILVTFTVDKKGKVIDIKLPENTAICKGYDEEIIRVFSSSPRWTPGRHKGEKIIVTFTIPIN
jgi:hypothetical protein